MKISKIIQRVALVLVVVGLVLFIYNETNGDILSGLADKGDLIHVSGLVLWVIGMYLEKREKKKDEMDT